MSQPVLKEHEHKKHNVAIFPKCNNILNLWYVLVARASFLILIQLCGIKISVSIFMQLAIASDV